MAFLSNEGAISGKDYPFETNRGECRSAGKKALIKFPQLRHVQPGDTRALEAVLDRDYCKKIKIRKKAY